MKNEFLNSLEDIGWLISTHLKDKNSPIFNSFILHGNEDCPTKIELFKKQNPSYKTKPIATYISNEDGNLILKGVRT
jgi:hypothetical protein